MPLIFMRGLGDDLLGLLLHILFLIPSLAWATTPTVTFVTGTFQKGQTLTLTGTYMMDENKTNWGVAYKTGTKYGFEGSGYTADGYSNAPDYNPQDRGYDSTVKLMGSNSFKGRIYTPPTSSSCPGDNHSCGLYITLSEDGITGSDIYVRLYSRWYSSGAGDLWPQSHIKMLDVQGTGTQMYFQPNTTGGSRLPTEMNMVYDGAGHPYSVANLMTQNRWYCMEARFKWSSPYNFTAWVDGVQLASVTPKSVGSYTYVLFNIINACKFSGLDLSNWTDAFAVSTSRVYPSSMIEIGNNSDYGLAKKVKQAPVFLSDTSIQVTCDLMRLGAGPYYLWVTNNRQERSATYKLSGGNGGSPNPVKGLSFSGGSLK